MQNEELRADCDRRAIPKLPDERVKKAPCSRREQGYHENVGFCQEIRSGQREQFTRSDSARSDVLGALLAARAGLPVWQVLLQRDKTSGLFEMLRLSYRPAV